jgi:GH24 family phage-related lysozyme (muramidase)
MTSNNEWMEAARKIVSNFEGCVLKSYPDPGTGDEPWTIGYGHTGKEIKKGMTISKAMAEGYLTIDLKEAADSVFTLLPMAAKWTSNQQAALISFVFNVGHGALADSTLRKRLLNGESPKTVIEEELPRWNKGGDGTVMPGLVRRRNAEVNLFRLAPVTIEAKPPIASINDQPLVWPLGMVGPKKRPDLKPGDYHIIANDINERMTAYTFNGQRLWEIPCLCRGQGGEAEWEQTAEDTPPGLYLVGKVYRDYEEDPSENFSATRRSYGWFSFDLIGQEGQEGPGSRYGRDGIMIHGGGSACGWPGAWLPRQQLFPTLGCIRLHNVDLKEKILPLLGSGRIWVSVLQEAKR